MSSTRNSTESRIDLARVMVLATKREAEVLHLRMVGYSYREISDMLPGKPEPHALRRRFFRFREKVRKLMEAGR